MGAIRDEDVHDGVKKKSKKRKKEESVTSREEVGSIQVCDKGYEKMNEFLGNANASAVITDFDENQITNKVTEKLDLIEDKKKGRRKKKKDDLGVGENRGGGGSKRKEKSVGSKTIGRTNVASVTNNRNGGTQPSNRSTPKKKWKKVTFSGHDEYFPLLDNSSNCKKKLGNGSKGNRSPDDGLIRGKRFSKEEDELVGKAVLDYIEEHQLGENGLEMVLKCKSYPQVKDCWKEIGKALPHRPYMSIYYRAHILFERSETRKWAPEELELVRRFHEKHGADWRTLADELGKHRFHVKDAWRRIKLPNRKRGDWSQDEYQSLFNLVNMDLSMRAFQEKKLKHGMLRDNISWEAISEKLSTRTNAMCCQKWYDQLSSPLVGEGRWANTDDYRLLMSLSDLDAACEEDVDWDGLIEHRSGDVCRERWTQMVRHIGQNGTKPFGEQVEILSHRYCPDLLEAREAYDSKPAVD